MHGGPKADERAEATGQNTGQGPAVGGGITECQMRRPLWLPYAEVERIGDATEHARRLGAAVLLEPRQGPSGWRSVVSSPVAGEVALWQPKR